MRIAERTITLHSIIASQMETENDKKYRSRIRTLAAIITDNTGPIDSLSHVAVPGPSPKSWSRAQHVNVPLLVVRARVYEARESEV